MFSNGMFDKVAELADEPQGVILPPGLPNGFGQKWYSEGDLINKLYETFGTEKTIDYLQKHRDEYITSADFAAMAEAGISSVRVPVGWWAFTNQSTCDDPILISDPVYDDRKFVTIPHVFLKKTLTDIKNAGMKALLDIHAFPGGSASGSYNGIYPNTPVFFKNESLQDMGFEIIHNLCNFYQSLETDVRSSIMGITLMNEPAHIMPEDKNTMELWLANAIDIFRQRIANQSPHPLLFVNLIGSCMSDNDMLEFMVKTFTQQELEQWAVLDVHVYYAWDGSRSGCMDMYDDCSYACSVDTSSESYAEVVSNMYASAATSHSFFISNGSVPLVGCSEFSLATYHDSNNACRGYNMLQMMHDAQAEGFAAQGMQDKSLFWTWKMPYGGSHEDAWSLQNYLQK